MRGETFDGGLGAGRVVSRAETAGTPSKRIQWAARISAADRAWPANE